MKSLYLIVFALVMVYPPTADARRHSYHHNHRPHHSISIGVLHCFSHYRSMSVSTPSVILSDNTYSVTGANGYHHRHCGYRNRQFQLATQKRISASYTEPRYVSEQAREIAPELPAKPRVVTWRNGEYQLVENRNHGLEK